MGPPIIPSSQDISIHGPAKPPYTGIREPDRMTWMKRESPRVRSTWDHQLSPPLKISLSMVLSDPLTRSNRDWKAREPIASHSSKANEGFIAGSKQYIVKLHDQSSTRMWSEHIQPIGYTSLLQPLLR